MSCKYSTAWRNGRPGVESSTRPPHIEQYYNDYSTAPNYANGERRQYYSTHDFIAETALEYYIAVSPSQFLTRLYNNEDNMKMYYLVGTECPDMNVP